MKRTTVECFTQNGLRWRSVGIRWKTVRAEVSDRRAEGSRAGATNASECRLVGLLVPAATGESTEQLFHHRVDHAG